MHNKNKKNSVLLDLKGKNAIVTGGAQGIGYGIAHRLAEAGTRVLIADMNKEACDKAVAELKEMGHESGSYILDVSNEDQVRDMVNYVIDNWGSVDILVNNAGIYPQIPLSTMTFDDFKKVINVNLNSVFLTTKYVSESMKKQAGG